MIILAFAFKRKILTQIFFTCNPEIYIGGNRCDYQLRDKRYGNLNF